MRSTDSLKGASSRPCGERLERTMTMQNHGVQSARVKTGCWLPNSAEERQAVPPRGCLKWVWRVHSCKGKKKKYLCCLLVTGLERHTSELS